MELECVTQSKFYKKLGEHLYSFQFQKNNKKILRFYTIFPDNNRSQSIIFFHKGKRKKNERITGHLSEVRSFSALHVFLRPITASHFSYEKTLSESKAILFSHGILCVRYRILRQIITLAGCFSDKHCVINRSVKMSDWERETIPSRLLSAETLEGILRKKGL